MMNKKKAQILLRNVVYSSYHDERDKRGRDECVCLGFHNGAASKIVFGKATL